MKLAQTYLFYDIETTGLNKAFDQVLQFAAIRTDLELQEIARYEWRVKLNPDVTPSPQAMLTHGIDLASIAQGLPEYTVIQYIHQLMNEPGTISLGYNTLGFDDEFLRFAFYRNLLPPYTHQYANRCARFDIYPLTIMYHLFKQDILQWPVVANEIKMKLDLINQANNLVAGRAHDAMVDVEITLALAKLFKAERDMWNYVTANFNKEFDEGRLASLPCSLTSVYGSHPEGLMILGKIGAAQRYQAPVLLLGNHITYKKQVWLRLDTDYIASLTPNTIAQTTKILLKKPGEPGFILPPKERFLSYLSPERRALANVNKEWLTRHPDLFKLVIEHHRSFLYETAPDTDVDAGLYINGFWTRDEATLCQRFHSVEPRDKVALIASLKNPHLRKLAVRLIGRHFPDHLTPDLAEEFSHYLRRVHSDALVDSIVDFRGQPRLHPQAALREIHSLLNTPLPPEQKTLLTSLESYLKAKLTAHRAS